MSLRYTWMRLPEADYIPVGREVDEDNPDTLVTAAEGGALCLGGDEITVVTGEPGELACWGTDVVFEMLSRPEYLAAQELDELAVELDILVAVVKRRQRGIT